MPQDEGIDKKTIAKISFAAACLVLAIILTIRSCTGAGVLNFKTYKSPHLCAECGFAADYNREQRNALIEKAGVGYGILSCEQCQKASVREAVRCKNCRDVFPLVVMGDGVAPCPKCGTNPMGGGQDKSGDK